MARKMTRASALREAVRRWGKNATVSERRCFVRESRTRKYGMSCMLIHEQPCPGGRAVYSVGKLVMGMFNEIRGEGDTWEHALEDAAKHEQEEHERYLAALKKAREKEVR